MIQFPVKTLDNEEDEYCAVVDASGRELTTEEIVEAMNRFAAAVPPYSPEAKIAEIVIAKTRPEPEWP